MRYCFSILLIIFIVAMLGCGRKASQPLTADEIRILIDKVKAAPLVEVADDEVAVIATDLGRIVLELYPKVAPNHCRHFKRLANNGFYDGTKFHRVVPGFVIQGGDILSRDANPANDGTGDPGYTLPAEFSNIPHERGILSMARKGYSVDTAGSQFFICVGPAHQLDGQYTVFGRVIEGMEVVDKIVAAASPHQTEMPANPIVMNKVKVMKRHEL
ncbi:MAG: peptidylprolyl isomerase [candidate division KSB1 bacterium]|nr:peptidylprolyl isomerase [candidate division KSB1 bacterium]MDZ7369307.1 peptidylprolyl isomerase [candidate division KSB1 bacterium]MDZ7407352.1 peptidylprolyl isomerase [candidate division KSB1 bacterium]